MLGESRPKLYAFIYIKFWKIQSNPQKSIERLVGVGGGEEGLEGFQRGMKIRGCWMCSLSLCVCVHYLDGVLV